MPEGSHHCKHPPASRRGAQAPKNRTSIWPSVHLQHCNPISFPSVGQCISGGFPLPSFCLYYMRRSLLLQAAICTKLQKLFVYIPLFRHSVHIRVATVRTTRTTPPMPPAWCPQKKETRRSRKRPRCGRRHNETAGSWCVPPFLSGMISVYQTDGTIIWT